MSKDNPIWETFTLESPGQILEFLSLEGVNRLVEPAYREPHHELTEKLQSMVSPEAWRMYMALDNLKGECQSDEHSAFCKLIPAIVRTLETRTLLAAESWEDLLEAAITEAGLSPKKREDIVALQRLEDAC
jgi:hypothetical protein